jgi:hypothetical protein
MGFVTKGRNHHQGQHGRNRATIRAVSSSTSIAHAKFGAAVRLIGSHSQQGGSGSPGIRDPFGVR